MGLVCKKSASGGARSGGERAEACRTLQRVDLVRGQVASPARTPGGVKGGCAGFLPRKEVAAWSLRNRQPQWR